MAGTFHKSETRLGRWWRRYLARLAKANDELFHGKRPRCCDLK